VGYNKRYDPAYARVIEEVRTLRDLRLLRITTLESPIEPYVQQYNLRRGGTLPKDLAQTLSEDDAARLDAAVPDADALSRWAYRVPTRDSHRRRDVLSRELQGRADPLPRLRERRTASDHFGSGRAARHSAVRGRGRGASKSHAPSSTLRAGDGNGSQRTLVTE